jgi:two-component sensor histidine kinase
MQTPVSFYVDIPALRPATVGAYVLAFLAAGAAAALRIAIDPYVTGVQYITFFPAVVITTLISGFGAGLLCVALSTAAASFLVLEPRGSFYIERPADIVDLLLFILEALSYVILIAGLRTSLGRYRELSRDLEQRVEERNVELRDSRDRLETVVGELQHRTRNLVSIVGALANDTLRMSATFDDFKAIFQDRLGVLARVQGLLFRMKEGERVTLDELIGAELSAQSTYVGSVILDGPNGVRLRSGTVQTFALALHELVTNAVKYGALKEPNGHLTVRWRLKTSRSGKPWLHLDWKESGVKMPPSGEPPLGTGRGRDLIEQALPYQFGAQTTFSLEPDGVHCTISLPVSDHRPSEDDERPGPSQSVVSTPAAGVKGKHDGCDV